jgi:hypothetical protein
MIVTFQANGKESMLMGRQHSFGCQASHLCCVGWWADRTIRTLGGKEARTHPGRAGCWATPHGMLP